MTNTKKGRKKETRIDPPLSLARKKRKTSLRHNLVVQKNIKTSKPPKYSNSNARADYRQIHSPSTPPALASYIVQGIPTGGDIWDSCAVWTLDTQL